MLNCAVSKKTDVLLHLYGRGREECTSPSVPFNFVYVPPAAPPSSAITFIPFSWRFFTSSHIVSYMGASKGSSFKVICPGWSCRCMDARMICVTFVWCSRRGSSESGCLSGVVKVWTYITSRELEVERFDSVSVIDAFSLAISVFKEGIVASV